MFQVLPRGVQLHLGSHKQPHLQDTLVMSNLGYFQLKSAPGAWTLQLAPGRSRELYHIESSTGTVGDSAQTEALAEVSPPWHSKWLLSSICCSQSHLAYTSQVMLSLLRLAICN